MSDSERTVRKLSEGEFMRLFVKHEPVLRAYARTILPDWNSIDDAMQEASVTMWEKLGQLKDEEGFLPWAKVIIRFKCLAAAQNLRRERPVLSDEVLELLTGHAEKTGVDEIAAMRRVLRGCLNSFSQSHQELLLAPYGGQGRVKQLAEASGKSPNALYKSLGRLREKLAACVTSKLQLTGV